LKRNPRQIEVEKALIREDKEGFSAQLVSRKVKPETYMKVLPEAERQPREAEDRVSNVTCLNQSASWWN